MKKSHLIIVSVLVLILSCSSLKKAHLENNLFTKINFMTTDSVTVTGDLYLTNNSQAPLILLFHQATFSRGEYREIAPKLNKLGYNCLAIDQRSGLLSNGVKNETNKSAKKLNKPTKYVNAIPDLEATLNYAKTELKSDNIIIWGSSYSAALVLFMASKYTADIKGVLSFSPGEYFEIKDKSIESFTSKIKCPVFITSAKNEKNNWQGIYDNIKSPKSFYLPTTKGFHGSKALWSNKEGNTAYWKAVESFLNQLK